MTDFGISTEEARRRAEQGVAAFRRAMTGPPSAADLPIGSIVAHGVAAFLKTGRVDTAPWERTGDVALYGDDHIDVRLAARLLAVLRIGDGS